jgi:CBS domain-containing protein
MARATTVEDLMSVKVATLGQGDTLDIADGIMCMGRIRHLPVLDAGRVVGVVSQRDLFRAALGAALAFGIRRPQELMRSLEIRDVMSAPAVTVEPGALVQEAARTMAEKIQAPPWSRRAAVGILTRTRASLRDGALKREMTAPFPHKYEVKLS